MSPAETILVLVDIQANNARLVELTKQINENREALKAATEAGKSGALNAEELATKQVQLTAATKQAKDEIALLTRSNAEQAKANDLAAGSIGQLRAELALGTAAYNSLSAAQRDGTDAGQKLQAANRATSDQLKVLEGAIGDTRRNVGNYAGSIDPLIQQLVKLQEQQKRIPEGSAAYDQAQAKVIGFQQAVNDAGVKAGLTYDQTQAKVAGYGAAIAPVTAKLVQLEEEQKKAGEGSKEYAKIGFQIGAVKKELEKIPPEATKATDSIKGGFSSAIEKGLSPFKAQIEQSTGVLSKFKSGSDLVKEGLSGIKGAGEAGSLGLKAIAGGIALTGIGLFVIAISAVVSYFTQTAAGGKILKQVLAGVGAVINVLTHGIAEFGKGAIEAFTHPLDALAKLGDAIIHPIDSVKALASGFADVASEASRAADEAGRIEKESQRLVLVKRVIELEDRKAQGRIDVLLRSSKDVALSGEDRIKNLQEANRLEIKSSEDSILLLRRLQVQDERSLVLAKGNKESGEIKARIAERQLEIQDKLNAAGSLEEKIKVRTSLLLKGINAAAESARDQEITDAEKLRKTTDENRLHSFEADVAARDEREKAAAKFLSEEDRGRALQLAREVKLIADKKAADAAAYAADLRSLESNLDSRRLEQETAYAHGKIDKATYDKQVSLIDQAGYGTRLLLAKHYNQDISAAEKAQTRAHNAEVSKQTDAERAASEQRLNMATELGTSLGSIFASTLSETGQTLESFAGKVLILILDTLEKQVLAQQAAATAESLAQPDSVATFGASGLARAAVMNALITAAFEGTKALISKGTTQGFATGGYVSGAGTGTSDSIPAMLSNGESVMNANTTASYAPLLSYLNQLGGGVGFGSPAFSSNRQIDGGLTARAAGAGLFPSAAEIGAAVAKNVPTSLSVRDINVAQARSASVRLRTTLD